MFERFTGRARRVIVLSQEEARLLNHNYIGTEHILLGLLSQPESIAGTVLASFGFTRDDVRREVEERIGRGKKALSGHIPFTPRAKKTLELSLREALRIGHKYIGTEHILLGLIREGEGVAAQILRDQADLTELRAAVIAAAPKASAEPGDDEPEESAEETNAVLRWLRQRLTMRHAAGVPWRPDVPEPGTPAVRSALAQAARLAGPQPVGSQHLLLAALQDANSAASLVLTSLGVDIDELRHKLRTARVTGTSDEPQEQAGRRQMAIQVTEEMLTIVCTDPVIVAAGQEALRGVQARAAAAAVRERATAELRAATGESAGEEGTGAQATDEEAAAEARPESASVAANVIRGDLPAAAGLAGVWLELRKTLATLALPTPPSGRPRWPVGQFRSAAAPGEPDDPGAFIQAALDTAAAAGRGAETEQTAPEEPEEPGAAMP